MFNAPVKNSIKQAWCQRGQRRHLLVGGKGSQVVQRPRLFDAPLELQVHDKLAFASQVLHEQLHEDVKDVRLVNVSNGVADESPLRMENRQQGRRLVHLTTIGL